ncbi:outer envelope pore protein 16-4, chloroplastic-like [Pyrus communis]|uniref:outer envelope pore protein 16-4, chloroplastic-like n=1 Tax=Pyrus communis TaxID=23211 RepID=UPI0035C08488
MEGEPYDVVPCSSVTVDSILCIGTVNGLVAGAVARGAIAAMTRSWMQVIPMACLVSAFKVATDYARAV